MTRSRTLAERVASIKGSAVTGAFLRHAAPNREAFAGGIAGRWGESFPVIYLGRPLDSCVEEAYRHLVDETGVPAHLVKSRVLYRVRVEATNILDLRSEESRSAVGLSDSDIASPVGEYGACQRVAAVAHQLEYHGVHAPSATGLGETLALFRQRIGVAEIPMVLSEEQWGRLPARPGTTGARLTLVQE